MIILPMVLFHTLTGTALPVEPFASSVGTANNSASSTATDVLASTLPAEEIEQRLSFIADALHAGQTRAQWWTWSWVTAYSAATVAQVVAIPIFKTSTERDPLIIGAVESALPILALTLHPLLVRFDADRVMLLQSTAADRGAALHQAERFLIADALNEAAGRAWYVHLSNGLYNVFFGLLSGFALHHWWFSAADTVVGIGIGELMIFTQPIDLEAALDRYRAGQYQATESHPVTLSGGPRRIGNGGSGLTLGCRF